MCGLDIYQGEYYHRYATALGGFVSVERHHNVCPPERDQEEIEKEMRDDDEIEERAEEDASNNASQAA